jgi:hypothetical protein
MVERRRRIEMFETWRDGVLVAVVAALLVCAGVVGFRMSPSKAGPKMNGRYEVKFAGCGTGTGSANVNPNFLKIDGTMQDPVGNVLTFSAKKLDFDASTYRFKGDGTLDGIPAKVSGRLDPDDTSVKKCRIVATFVADDGKAGRIAGEHK